MYGVMFVGGLEVVTMSCIVAGQKRATRVGGGVHRRRQKGRGYTRICSLSAMHQ